MIEPELEKYLVEINTHLLEIKKNSKSGIWRAFFNGMFGALGYVVGILIVVFILGWILQKVGLLQSFQEQVKSFTNLVQSAQKLIPSGGNNEKVNNNPSSTTNGGGVNSGGATTVTLPNGQQIQVNLPAGYGQ